MLFTLRLLALARRPVHFPVYGTQGRLFLNLGLIRFPDHLFGLRCGAALHVRSGWPVTSLRMNRNPHDVVRQRFPGKPGGKPPLRSPASPL
ncbi:hypothetical protein SAMN00790413_00807 [Deinococcus hopiensis KR-140]|uniref:Uncharacterized protein n=1 Tax=Deinococcus hopiensis KR-140 TaxID=695939 RepID=A0A1W1VBU9_9DEIO|nr:hypothetical protein SAMN00790413_00807 [Deinococcus hopiensis KR-140]